MLQHFMERILESDLFDEKNVREYNQQDTDGKDWDNTVEHWKGVLDAMERFERGAGGTAKKAKFESKNAAYIKERVQMAKEEAFAEIRAEQAATRKQDSEEAKALINLLQGRTDAQAQEAATVSSTLEAIMAVQEKRKSKLRRSNAKTSPCSMRPRAPATPAPHSHQLQ